MTTWPTTLTGSMTYRPWLLIAISTSLSCSGNLIINNNLDPLINYYQHSHLVDHEAGQGLCGRLDLTAEESTAQTLELKILYYCEQRHCVGGLGQHSFKTIFEIFVAFPTCHNREDSSRIQDTFSQVFLGRRCWGLPWTDRSTSPDQSFYQNNSIYIHILSS